MPACSLAIRIRRLRALSINDVPKLASVERHFDLLLVECVELCRDGIGEARDVALGMQHFPRLDAGLTNARLEYHHESIEAVDDEAQVFAEQSRGRGVVGVVQIIQLAWVRLHSELVASV